jgi:predicted GIY-YIG superfamily endonuclease
MTNSFFVYLLLCSDNSTYIGATVDLNHRLRQHNNELKGGARATTMKVKQGKTWQRACHIANFPDWRSALQFEWRWKQLSRKLPQHIYPLERRMQALIELLSLEKSTSAAIPFQEWETPIQVNIELEEAKQYYS